jgi:hypothetical protein
MKALWIFLQPTEQYSIQVLTQACWDGDFAIDNIVLSTFGNGYTSVSGTGTTGGNLEVPSGMYNIIVNKKLNTLYMIQIDKLSLIGSAPVASNGWANDVDMEYDPVSHTFSAVADMVAGEFKIRVNHDWTHSAGGQINKISFNPETITILPLAGPTAITRWS